MAGYLNQKQNIPCLLLRKSVHQRRWLWQSIDQIAPDFQALSHELEGKQFYKFIPLFLLHPFFSLTIPQKYSFAIKKRPSDV